MSEVITRSDLSATNVSYVPSVEQKDVPKTTPVQSAESGGSFIQLNMGQIELESPSVAYDPSQTTELIKHLESIDSKDLNYRLKASADLVENKLNGLLSSAGVSGEAPVNSLDKNEQSNIFALLMLLFQLAKDNRELNSNQREIATTAAVSSIEAQAAELRTAKGAMIAMAIVSGVLALGTGIMGGLSAKKSFKQLGESGEVNDVLTGNHKLKDELEAMKATEAADSPDLPEINDHLRSTRSEIGDLTRQGAHIDTQIRARDSQLQVGNAVVQGVGQISNNAGNVTQTASQANQKEKEAEGTLEQAQKQKSDDFLAADDSVIKQIIDIWRSLADAENQALKAATSLS